MGLEERYENDQRAGALLLCGKAEKAGVVSLENRGVWGHLIADLQCLNWASKKDGDSPF